MPIPIVQILADGESGRTVMHRGRQVVFRHSIYTRLNDVVEALRDRIVLAVDGPVWELVSPDTIVRSHAFISTPATIAGHTTSAKISSQSIRHSGGRTIREPCFTITLTPRPTTRTSPVLAVIQMG